MAFYHVVFSVCMTVQGMPEHCEPERLIDTKFSDLVGCYSAAKTVEKMTTESFRKEAKANNLVLLNVDVKTQCITTSEGEVFLQKWGASALIITGKKYD